MSDSSWQVHEDRGFLIYPDPLPHLSALDSCLPPDVIEQLEDTAAAIPDLVQNGQVRRHLEDLPLVDFQAWLSDDTDPRLLERLVSLYGTFTNAYLHSDPPTKHLPAVIAVPFDYLSKMVERPPVMSYANMVLNNWQRVDPDGDLSLENIDLLQTFTGLTDEAWFFRVHAAIEARSGAVLQAANAAITAVREEDDNAMLSALRTIRQGLVDIVQIFHRMPEHCDPDVYYQAVRPFLFGLSDVIFEGVDTQPRSYHGGSGAQSSVIPAVNAALGVRHEDSHLTHYLNAIRAYMPIQHRAYIDNLQNPLVREFASHSLVLSDAYNHCLRQIMTFRRAHFYYAKTYIFEKSTDPMGTGGTAFMSFLNRLIDETATYLI